MQDVATRWNSSYYMLECILKQQQPLCATLLEIRKTDLMPTDGEITTIATPLTQLPELSQDQVDR